MFKDAVQLIGGKGAGLVELGSIAGLKVPEWVAIPIGNYERFIQDNYLGQEIDRLEKVSEEWIVFELMKENTRRQDECERRISAIGEALKYFIEHGEMPSDVKSEIMDTYYQLGQRIGVENPRVSVRSSANIEDGLVSCAGQHATLLNQRGKDEILKAVKFVWASVSSESAIAYRNRQRAAHIKKQLNGKQLNEESIRQALQADRLFGHSQVKLAVILQRMIEADVAGVAFTVNPQTGESNFYIQATAGLGELLVGSEVIPDTWVVEPKTGHILQKKAGKRDRKLVCDGHIGVVTISLSDAENERLSLEDEQVFAISQTLSNIAEYYEQKHGHGYIDTEFAFEGDNLYWLQVRPETVWAKGKGRQEETKVPQNIAANPQEVFQNGETVSQGVASGALQIAYTPKEVRKGVILVTIRTNHGWAQKLGGVKGVISELGGPLDHIGIVSRELGIPAIAAAKDAIKRLSKFAGQVVTLDALRRIVYLGGNASEEQLIALAPTDSDEQISEEEEFEKRWLERTLNHQTMVDEMGRWHGRPNYCLGRLQRDLYYRAFLQLEKRFQLTKPLMIKTVGEILYVKYEDDFGLLSHIRKFSLDELEKCLTEWNEAQMKYIQFTQDFVLTKEKAERFLELYQSLVMWMHVAWPLLIAFQDKLREQLKPIPAEHHPAIFEAISTPQESETLKSIRDYEKLLARACMHSNMFASRTLDFVPLKKGGQGGCWFTSFTDGFALRFKVTPVNEIHQQLMVKDVVFWNEVLSYAKAYKHTPADWRLKPPVDVILERLKQDILSQTDDKAASQRQMPKQGKNSRVEIIQKVQPDIKAPHTFERLLDLSVVLGVLRENSHHIKIRGQWVIREQFMVLGRRLAEQGRLEKSADIFEVSVDEFIMHCHKNLRT
jgi:phosphohistidine swiveling domain-containing protein